MPRTCVACTHQEAKTIDQAIVAREPFRRIGTRFGISEASVRRHKRDHLALSVSEAHDAEEVIRADGLLDQAQSLQEKALSILSKAEAAGDLRSALGAIRESRSNLELLAKMLSHGYKDPEAHQVSPEVGYDINELLKDPEIREMVLALDAKMRAISGGEGIILEGTVTKDK